MNSIIQKQEEVIAQLQLAVEHYLESGDLETALAYSELFKLNCEAYKCLVGSVEVKEEKPAFRFGKTSTPVKFPSLLNAREATPRPPNQAQLDYQKQMREVYAPANAPGFFSQQPQGAFIPQQAVVSQYSYGDGQDNPKIRANDSNGNWGGNGEPNEIITPPQQLINNYLKNAPGDDDNLWGEDPRRNINGFVPQ